MEYGNLQRAVGCAGRERAFYDAGRRRRADVAAAVKAVAGDNFFYFYIRESGKG